MAAVWSVGVVAQEPPKTPKPTKPAARPAPAPAPKAAPAAPAEPLLTREELRACMERKTRLREQTDRVSQLQTELQKEKSEILSDGEALKNELTTLDRSNVAAVESYNARATARDQRINGFEPRVSDFNAKVQALNDERSGYSRDCENRRFDERDEKALQKNP